MLERTHAGVPALLTFTKDYREFLRGDLVPGGSVEIYFDAERLPQVIDQPEAFIDCHVAFWNGKPPTAYRLESYGGLLQHKAGNEPGGGSMLSGRIDIPQNAQQLELWFTATIGNSQLAYDSDMGKNFSFPFVQQDVRVLDADVRSGRFSVSLETARGVSDPFLDYRVTNKQPIAPKPTRVGLSPAGKAADGWDKWVTPEVRVPDGAVVSFSLTYRRGTHEYFDDNHHAGYLAPRPAALMASSNPKV